MHCMKGFHFIVLLLSGASLGFAVMILIHLVTSSKYVCTDNSDQLIVGLRAMEWVLVICSLGTTTLAVVINHKKEYAKNTLSYGSLINGAIVFLTLITYIIVKFTSGCSNCLTQGSVDAAMGDSADSSNFILESAEMTGAESIGGSFIDNYLTPEWFQIRQNYCRTTLQAIPGSTNDYLSSHAQRCLVYSCTNLVPEYGVMEGTFYACCSLQIIAAILIVMNMNEIMTTHDSVPMAKTLSVADKVPGEIIKGPGDNDQSDTSILFQMPNIFKSRNSHRKDAHLTF